MQTQSKVAEVKYFVSLLPENPARKKRWENAIKSTWMSDIYLIWFLSILLWCIGYTEHPNHASDRNTEFTFHFVFSQSQFHINFFINDWCGAKQFAMGFRCFILFLCVFFCFVLMFRLLVQNIYIRTLI